MEGESLKEFVRKTCETYKLNFREIVYHDMVTTYFYESKPDQDNETHRIFVEVNEYINIDNYRMVSVEMIGCGKPYNEQQSKLFYINYNGPALYDELVLP